MYTLIIDGKELVFEYETGFIIDGALVDLNEVEGGDPEAHLAAARARGEVVEVEGTARVSIEGAPAIIAKQLRWPYSPTHPREDHVVTIIEAAELVGIEIPHFCYHPALSRPANCRMCLVEIVGGLKLQPACYSQVKTPPWIRPPVMTVHTKSDVVLRARKAVLEFILLNHPVDCPVCDQAGECKLQDYYFKYSSQQSRLKTGKVNKVKVFPIGPEVVYDGERCILCTRCVRFCDEVTKTHELTTVQRADMSEIRAFPGRELDNDYSLCTVDLCPVGALTNRDFRFKCRVWYLETTPSICTGCARGCNVHLEHFKGEVQRYRPRENHEVNGWWMCDHGRQTHREIHADRLLSPSITMLGQRQALPVQRAIAAAVKRLRIFIEREGVEKLAVVLSPQSSCEELFALFSFAVALGVTRFYANGKGDAAFTLRNDPSRVSDDFLIHRDKNPNTTGLMRLADAFGVEVKSAEDLMRDIEDGDINTSQIQGVYMSGADFEFPITPGSAFVRRMRKLELFFHATPRLSALSKIADLSLPVCTHAEQDGSFVNADGLLQRFERAFEPHGQSMPEWMWLARLGKRLRLEGLPTDFDALRRATVERLATASPDASSKETAASASAE